MVGPTFARSADAEPAEARLFCLRPRGAPGRSSIITMAAGLTVLFRMRVTKSLVTGPFLERSSLELTSPTCQPQRRCTRGEMGGKKKKDRGVKGGGGNEKGGAGRQSKSKKYRSEKTRRRADRNGEKGSSTRSVPSRRRQ